MPPAISLDGLHRPVLVIGGGQAGLSVSYCLKQSEIEHLVLERDEIGCAWMKQRWDSFCLVTPNWQCDLPGYPYRGDDPNGFIKKDAIVDYVKGYAAHFAAPVCEGVSVTRVSKVNGLYTVETSAGTLTAGAVVLATGGYHAPKIPAMAAALPDTIVQVHSSTYRNPGSLPKGAVLIVGTGQSGAQIAEDLHLAGRKVHLLTGSAPRSPRFYRGRDVTDWLVAMGHYDMPVDKHPMGEGVRRKANHYLTGRDGGHELDLRAFARDGMRLYGRLSGIDGARVTTAPTLRANLDEADASANRIRAQIDGWIAEQGVEAPAERHYAPFWQPDGEPAGLDLQSEGVGAVIWCTGFSMDFSWVDLPVLDADGYPTHWRGQTKEAGLYVVGLPWLYTWGSGRFSGVARDARHIVGHLCGTLEAVVAPLLPDEAARGERRSIA